MRATFEQLLIVSLLGAAVVSSSSCGAVDLGRHDSPVTPAGPDAASSTDAKTTPPDVSGVACGSRGLAPCPAGSTCYFSRAAQCGDLDAPGVCRDYRAVFCAPDNAPVCGCDGKTYMNECVANVVGTSARHDGACAP